MAKLKDVLANSTAFPAEVVSFANKVDAMQDAYASMAAGAAAELFTNQQELDLSGEQMKAALGHIIDIRQFVNERSEAALEIISAPKS